MITVGVLALQGDVREHLHALEDAGARGVAVRRESELRNVEALVIPGGESTAMWKLAKAFDLLGPLREQISAGMPAFGSCAGMIMLANTIADGAEGQETIGGMDVVVRRNAFGRQVDSFEVDEVVEEFGPDPVRMVFIRAPWVEQVGPDVRVLSTIDVDGPRIVAIQQGSLLATSFHPEVTGDSRVHRYFVEKVCAVRGRG